MIAEVITIVFVVIVAIKDFSQLKIPNIATYSALSAGLVLGLLPDVLPSMTSSLTGLALGIVLSLMLYQRCVIGGGDVKLLAALGTLLGASAVIDVMFYALVLAWPVALIMLVRSRLVHPSERNAPLRFPFAVAVAPAVLLTIFVPSARISPELGRIIGLS